MADSSSAFEALAGLVHGTQVRVCCALCREVLGYVYFSSPSGYAKYLCPKCPDKPGTEVIGTPTGMIFRAAGKK